MHVCDVRWQIERVPSGQIRADEGGGGDGSLRGTHLDGIAPLHASLVVVRYAARREEGAEKGAMLPA